MCIFYKSAACRSSRKVTRGFTLVELVVFISIVSVAVAGVVGALSYVNRSSANPLVQRQAMAIAEALLQEIQQTSFSYCDPNDTNAATATSYAGCAADSQQALTGPSPATESRYNQSNTFDNVADYGNFTMPDANCAGICLLGDATPINGLTGYVASVALAAVGGSSSFPGLSSDAALQITVTVTGPANTRVVLRGYRVRYAPRV